MCSNRVTPSNTGCFCPSNYPIFWTSLCFRLLKFKLFATLPPILDKYAVNTSQQQAFNSRWLFCKVLRVRAVPKMHLASFSRSFHILYIRKLKLEIEGVPCNHYKLKPTATYSQMTLLHIWTTRVVWSTKGTQGKNTAIRRTLTIYLTWIFSTG